MTLHPIFAEILEKQLGVKMCDDDQHDDVDYDYQDKNGNFIGFEEDEGDGNVDEDEARSDYYANVL